MKNGFFATTGVAVTIMAAVLAFNRISVASMKYECWTYVNGHPDKMTYIVADRKADAEAQAPAKFRDLGTQWDYIQCK